MAQYKPLLFTKLTDNAPVRNSMEWNVWVKSVPFKIFPDLKDIPSRDWVDENGDDEYIPDTPKYKAYEIECEFVYIGAYESANTQIRSFLNYLSTGGAFKFYDTYTKIGRTNVRYVSFSEDALHRREGDTDKVIFSVTLKVNDPITDITLTQQ